MMSDSVLLHELFCPSAARKPESVALSFGDSTLTYAQLSEQVAQFSSGVLSLGLERGDRVAIYLDKRFETVIASFGATQAGCAMVPINPILKSDQVAYILRDCGVRVLVTSAERHLQLGPVLRDCPILSHVVLTGDKPPPNAAHAMVCWPELLAASTRPGHRVIDIDLAAILYTSGSTGKPKGVVLSHRNMVAGAKSVAGYLGNTDSDTLLAALPLSFDAGFSQLTTGFHAGARVALLNYLLPRDVLKAIQRDRITGLTAVPPMYIQLSQIDWPQGAGDSLRYFANTGGRMPRETLDALRRRVPHARPFLMYGLTEAFRSTYLPPEELDRRPDSIGKAIPNADILVLRDDGSLCADGEAGELVHRGALVGLGYWNDPVKTAERYKLLPPGLAGRESAFQLPEYAVYSGDTVRRDSDGFLYFIGRRDEMIKTSGYRVSPTEVEEAIYATGMVGECAAFGVEHPTLGQSIRAVLTPISGQDSVDVETLLIQFRDKMPSYMVPAGVDVVAAPLPRNPNGKIDRKLLAALWSEKQTDAPERP